MMSTYFINLDSVNNYQSSLSIEEILEAFKDGLYSIHWNNLDQRTFSGYDYLEIDVCDNFIYSDYSGSLVEKNNIACFLEDLPESDERYVVQIFGSYGSSSLGFIKYSDTTYEDSEYIRDCLAALENYCSLDDDSLSALEWEQYQEYWDSDGKRDMINHLKKNISELRLNDDLVNHLDGFEDHVFLQLYDTFEHNWRYEFFGQDITVNFENVTMEYSDLIDWVVEVNRKDLAFQKMRKDLLFFKTGNSLMVLFSKYKIALEKGLNELLYGKQLSLFT